MKSAFEKDEWMREFTKLISSNARKRMKRDKLKKEEQAKRDSRTDSSNSSSNNSSPSDTFGFSKGETVQHALREKFSRHSLEIREEMAQEVKLMFKAPEVVVQEPDKTTLMPPPSPQKDHAAPTLQHVGSAPKKSIAGMLARMKDRKKEAPSTTSGDKKYLTWGPTSELVTGPVSREDVYLNNLVRYALFLHSNRIL
jgi:hypothetical protein